MINIYYYYKKEKRGYKRIGTVDKWLISFGYKVFDKVLKDFLIWFRP